MEFVLKQIIYSIGILMVGILTYDIIIRLIEYPGSKKIERVYESDHEKNERIRKMKYVRKRYFIALVWLVMIINIIIYYLIR